MRSIIRVQSVHALTVENPFMIWWTRLNMSASAHTADIQKLSDQEVEKHE